MDNIFNKSDSDPEAQYTTASPTSFQGLGRTMKFTLTGRLRGWGGGRMVLTGR